jgi:hypothetical protein
VKFRLHRPTPALVVASFALVVAMSGTAFAVVATQSGDALIAKRTLSGNRLRLNTVTGAEINESKLGTVPKANLASHLPALVWHNFALVNDWVNYNGTTRPPAWALDAQGIVHFRGAIEENASTSTVFTQIPVAIRPATNLWLVTDMLNAAPGRIDVWSNGNIEVEPLNNAADAQGFTNLDGVTYSLH